jgi:CDP-glucose 4,6-dehydratase
MSFWRGKRVAVTGCSGLVGGALCRILLEHGADLTGIDIDHLGTLGGHGIFGAFPLAKVDIVAQPFYMPDDFNWDSTEVLIHLAAQSNVGKSAENPSHTYNLNVMGTVNVLNFACQIKPQAVVVASTNHVYGDQEVYPTTEETHFNRFDPYTVSKACADSITRSYAETYSLPTAAVRNTNCYGPYDPHHDHLIPSVILARLRDEVPMLRSDGQTKKAYLYVDDVAEAYMATAQWLCEGGLKGTAFNATTESISSLDLAHKIAFMTGGNSVSTDSNGDGGPHEFLDDTALRAATGWAPKVSLKEGLRRTIEAFSKQGTTVGGPPRTE